MDADGMITDTSFQVHEMPRIREMSIAQLRERVYQLWQAAEIGYGYMCNCPTSTLRTPEEQATLANSTQQVADTLYGKRLAGKTEQPVRSPHLTLPEGITRKGLIRALERLHEDGEIDEERLNMISRALLMFDNIPPTVVDEVGIEWALGDDYLLQRMNDAAQKMEENHRAYGTMPGEMRRSLGRMFDPGPEPTQGQGGSPVR